MRTSSGSESNFNDPISTDDDRLDRGRSMEVVQLVALNKTQERKVIAATRDSFHRPTHLLLRLGLILRD